MNGSQFLRMVLAAAQKAYVAASTIAIAPIRFSPVAAITAA
jgi:hypothetical protein